MKAAFLAGAAAAALFAIPAHAADMPLKAPPRAAVTTSWAGFYIGAHVGYGFSNTASSSDGFGVSDRFIGIGSKGWAAGGLAGYNVMLSPRWVGGIEVDGSWQDIDSTLKAEGLDFTVLSLDWSASVRGRIGYLMTPTTMLFVTGGWTWSKLEAQPVLGLPTVSKSINGPQVGFGVETMLADNWIVRTEYLQSFYDEVNFGEGSPNLSPWVGVIRSALIYKVGPSTPTPWPDRQPTPIWAGFYIGGMIGPFMASAKVSAPGLSFDGLGISSVFPSALAGYNVFLAPRWIASIEGEIAPNISTSDVEIEWTGVVRGRIGYLLTPAVLAYAHAGWGTSSIKNVTFSGTSASIPIERINALGVGTGVEAAVTDRWRLRADYTYVFTDTIDVVVPGNVAATAKASGHMGRVGAIYHLGGP
jgi:outer membrane immunogenic protein